ncbi:MAG: hypothetical protein ABI594_01295 [Ginsengibacter sp.]
MVYKKKENKRKNFLIKALLLAYFAGINTIGFSQESIATEISIDATKTTGSCKPIWSYFGYNEANFTTMKDGKKLIKSLKG